MENSFSFLSLFTGRDLMTLTVSLILVAASIMSWAVIIEKIRLWRFQKQHPVSVKSTDNMDTIVDKLIRPFDKNLWFLSMVSYVAPFIGLFGTVWGVMDSFAAIGVNQSVSIGVIAPGLAVALAKKHPLVYAGVGIHPSDAFPMTASDDDQLVKWTKEEKVVAIGEIGLDYYWEKDSDRR
ncbi:MAG: MotA/TolQ/ExbB proton channel family protein, partial [Alphaproteobacteria bacterium]|nr:MotA/TolQ/ExbB proton channel family protein [Alphaproteobacteria bacterium]